MTKFRSSLFSLTVLLLALAQTAFGQNLEKIRVAYSGTGTNNYVRRLPSEPVSSGETAWMRKSSTSAADHS